MAEACRGKNIRMIRKVSTSRNDVFIPPKVKLSHDPLPADNVISFNQILQLLLPSKGFVVLWDFISQPYHCSFRALLKNPVTWHTENIAAYAQSFQPLIPQ